jgi:hypothetical protein
MAQCIARIDHIICPLHHSYRARMNSGIGQIKDAQGSRIAFPDAGFRCGFGATGVHTKDSMDNSVPYPVHSMDVIDTMDSSRASLARKRPQVRVLFRPPRSPLAGISSFATMILAPQLDHFLGGAGQLKQTRDSAGFTQA